MLRRLYDFIIYSNIIVALGVFIAFQHSASLFHLNHHHTLAYLLSCAVACLYNIHWMLLPAEHLRNQREHYTKRFLPLFIILTVLSALGGLYFLVQLSYTEILSLVPVFGASVLYLAPKVPAPFFNFFRRNVRMKTTCLAITWTYSMDVLPFLLSESSFNIATLLYFLYRYLLVYAVCVLFDYRDRTHDLKQGIRSFLYHLNEKQIQHVIWILCTTAMACNVCLGMYWNGTIIVLQTIPLLLLLLTVERSIRKPSDIWYFLVLDNQLFLVPWLHVIFNVGI